jgi:hypothetical protein
MGAQVDGELRFSSGGLQLASLPGRDAIKAAELIGIAVLHCSTWQPRARSNTGAMMSSLPWFVSNEIFLFL